MTNRFILSLTAVALLVSCQPKGKTGSNLGSAPTPSGSARTGTPDVPIRTGTPSSIPVPGSKGTSDQGGGGNVIKGEPIDFYKKDITSWPEYIKFIQPIDDKINSIRSSYQGENDVAYLKTIVLQKNWYLIPLKIDELDKNQIGTGFQSEQAAYQTSKAIFISETVYQSLTEEQKAKLLLHEIVMAFYRLKYESMDFYCKAFLKQQSREHCLSSISGSNALPMEVQPQTLPNDVFLEATEYESIRHVTEWLFSNFKTMTKKDFDGKLMEKNFDPRVFNTAYYISSHETEKERSMSIGDFLLLLRNAKMTGTMPTHCGFSPEGSSVSAHRKCQIEFLEEGEDLKVKITVDETGGKKIEAFEFVLELPYNSYNAKKEKGQINLSKMATRTGVIYWEANLREKREAKEGVRTNTIEFYLKSISENDFALDVMTVRPLVWLKGKDNGILRGADVKPIDDEEIIRYISTQPTL